MRSSVKRSAPPRPTPQGGRPTLRLVSISLAAATACATPCAAQSAPHALPDMSFLGVEIAAARSWTNRFDRLSLQAQISVDSNSRTWLLVIVKDAQGQERFLAYMRPNADHSRLMGPGENQYIERQDSCIRFRDQNTSRPLNLGMFCADPSGEPTDIALTRYTGRWTTTLGDMVLERYGAGLMGTIARPDADGHPRVFRRLVFSTGSPHRVGAWAAPDSDFGGNFSLPTESAEGSFTGFFENADGSLRTWSGRRVESTPAPAPQPEPPAPSSPVPTPAPGAPGSPTGPAPRPSGGFERIGEFDVRFERLERPRSGGVVRAVVSIRNASQQVQHLPSGVFRAILTDADGAGQERNQLWRGSGEPAQLFNGTPALQPGGELTVRFTFNPDIPQLDRLVLMRGEQKVEFDLTGR